VPEVPELAAGAELRKIALLLGLGGPVEDGGGPQRHQRHQVAEEVGSDPAHRLGIGEA
jgi:hypothetical protein